jgi:hypothetical protein
MDQLATALCRSSKDTYTKVHDSILLMNDMENLYDASNQQIVGFV